MTARITSLDRADALRVRRWLRRHAPARIRDTALEVLDLVGNLQRTLDARERDERWRAAGQRQLDDEQRRKLETVIAQRDTALQALRELQKMKRSGRRLTCRERWDRLTDWVAGYAASERNLGARSMAVEILAYMDKLDRTTLVKARPVRPKSRRRRTQR